MSTAAELDRHFREAAGSLAGGPARPDPAARVRAGSRLDGTTLLAIFDAETESRHLDFAARWMQQQGGGYYTIGAAGHEGNAALAAALRPTDPGLLHYRSGAFYCARARQVPGIDPVRDVLLGVAGAAARADRRRAAQGDRPGRVGHRPADVHDRLAPAPGARRRAGHRPGGE